MYIKVCVFMNLKLYVYKYIDINNNMCGIRYFFIEFDGGGGVS